MIPWKRGSIFQLLCLFGDFKEHPWMEIVNLGTRLFVNYQIQSHRYKTHQDKFEAFFQKSIEYGIIEMIPTPYIIKERTKKIIITNFRPKEINCFAKNKPNEKAMLFIIIFLIVL